MPKSMTVAQRRHPPLCEKQNEPENGKAQAPRTLRNGN